MDALRSLDSFIDITEDDLRRLVDLLSLRRAECEPGPALDGDPTTVGAAGTEFESGSFVSVTGGGSEHENSDRGHHDEGEAEAQLGETEASGGNRRTTHPPQLQHGQHRRHRRRRPEDRCRRRPRATASSTASRLRRRRSGGCYRCRGADERSGHGRTGSIRRRGPRAQAEPLRRALPRSVVGDDDRRRQPQRSRRLRPVRESDGVLDRASRTTSSIRHQRRGDGDRQHPDQPASGDSSDSQQRQHDQFDGGDAQPRGAFDPTQRSWRTSIEHELERRAGRERRSGRPTRCRRRPATMRGADRAESVRPSGPILRARWGPPPTASADVARLPVSPAWSRTAPRDRRRNHRDVDSVRVMNPHAEANQGRRSRSCSGPPPALCAIRVPGVVSHDAVFFERGGAWVSSSLCRESLPSGRYWRVADALFHFTKWGNLFADERFSWPYPMYDRMRADGPVTYGRPYRQWFVFGYDEVPQVLRSPHTATAPVGELLLSTSAHRKLTADGEVELRPLAVDQRCTRSHPIAGRGESGVHTVVDRWLWSH